MKVFIIPTWYPTPDKPNWCNWIKPHIEIVKTIADTTTILQVDQEASENSSIIIERNPFHYYLASGHKKKKRTIFSYGSLLNEYCEKLEILFLHAISIHGKPDILHAHVSMPGGYGAAMLGKKYSIPVIVTEHYSGFFSDNRFWWRLGYFYKKMRKNINGLYAVSPGFKNRIERIVKIKVDGVTPNPIDTELFNFEDNGSISNRLSFVSTGTFGKIKGTDILLKAFSQLDLNFDWHLTLIGNIPSSNKEYWYNLIQQIPSERLSILKPLNQNELSKIYSKSDVFIVSSRTETANVSMLEAMSCGCYVITSKIEAPETLLTKDVSGIFNSSVSELLGCLVVLLKKVPNNRFIQRGYVLNNFSTNILGDKLSCIYRSFIRNIIVNNIKL